MSVERKSLAECGTLDSEHPDVVAASEQTYDELHSKSYKNRLRRAEAHMHGVCITASQIFTQRLRDRGYAAHMINGTFSYFGVEYYEHYYAGVRSNRGLVKLDPTWVQFLDLSGSTPLEGVAHQPKVLVGLGHEAAEFARKAGVDEMALLHWDRKLGLATEGIEYDRPYVVSDISQFEPGIRVIEN